jgi:hypothetical protein
VNGGGVVAVVRCGGDGALALSLALAKGLDHMRLEVLGRVRVAELEHSQPGWPMGPCLVHQWQ